MLKVNPTMAQQIAQAAMAFQQQRTGHGPESVTVVLSDDTLVVTLHGGARARPSKRWPGAGRGIAGAGVHRQLFSHSSEPLRKEIKEITGVEVRRVGRGSRTVDGAVTAAFTTGTMVQVFLLARRVPPGAWTQDEPINPVNTTIHTRGATV